MRKVFRFIKKHLKLLLGSLLGLMVVLVATVFIMIVSTTVTIQNNLELQMRNVIRMVNYSREYDDDMMYIRYRNNAQNLKIVSELLMLEPDDITNTELLEEYGSFQGNGYFYVLTKDRELIYSFNEKNKEDFTDSRFDKLFAENYGELAYIDAEQAGDLYYQSVFDGKYYVVSADIRNEELVGYNDYIDAWVNRSSSLAIADINTGEIIAGSDESIIGSTLNLSLLESGELYDVDGKYLVTGLKHEERGLYFVTLTPLNLLAAQCLEDTRVEMVLFLISVIILVAFAIFLREDEIDPENEKKIKKRYFIKKHLSRYAALAVILTLFIGVGSILIVSINDATSSGEYIFNEAQACKEVISAYEEEVAIIEQMSKYVYADYGRVLTRFLSVHKDRISKDKLNELADLVMAEDITLFDREGKTICTSSPLDHLAILSDPNSALYKLRYVLLGKEIDVVTADANQMNSNNLIYAVSIRNDENIADGAIAFIVNEQLRNGILVHDNSGAAFNPINKDSDSLLIVVDEDGKIIYHKDNSKLGKNVKDDVLPADKLVDGYYGRIKTGGKDNLVIVEKNRDGDGFKIFIEPFTWLSNSAIKVVVAEIIFFPWLALWIMYYGLGNKEHYKEKKVKKETFQNNRYTNSKKRWSELDSSQKLKRVIGGFVHLFGLYLIILYIQVKNGSTNPIGLEYIVSGQWDKAFNIFALVGNICLVCVISTLIIWINEVLRVVANISGQEGATILKLFASLTKYAGVLAGFYVASTNFGIDAKTTLASLGIAGFGLTFGAQDIIKDFIAGIFILVEGNFKIGDLLLINGEYFFVKSVGVRTTRVEAWGRIKVINNSQMTGIINIQNSIGRVNCDVMINKKYDIEEIEAMLKEELPKLRENYPEGVSAPIYRGVKSFEGNGTIIRFTVYCPPLMQGRMGRKMARDIKILMDKHNIDIPVTSYDIRYVEETDKNAE